MTEKPRKRPVDQSVVHLQTGFATACDLSYWKVVCTTKRSHKVTCLRCLVVIARKQGAST